MVTMDRAVLFMNEEQVGSAVRTHLGPNVEIQPYDAVFADVKRLKSSLTTTKKKVRRSATHSLSEAPFFTSLRSP